MKLILPCSISIIFLLSCTGKKSTPETPSNENIVITEAICIMNEAPLYEESGPNSQVISSVQLGEVVPMITNEPFDQDPDPGKYYEVQLRNVTSAWISGSAIFTNAIPAAIMQEAPIYNHTESDAKADKNFMMAEFVVITSENDDWVKLTGADKKKEGWVKKKFISTDPGDVHVAILAQNYLLESNGKMIIDKLPDFIMQLPDKNTKLAVELQKIMDKEVAHAIEQSISDYEEQQIDEAMFEED